MRLELQSVITDENVVTSKKFTSARKKFVKEDNEILSTRKSLEGVLTVSARGHRQHEKH